MKLLTLLAIALLQTQALSAQNKSSIFQDTQPVGLTDWI
jgi:hypothetical protein